MCDRSFEQYLEEVVGTGEESGEANLNDSDNLNQPPTPSQGRAPQPSETTPIEQQPPSAFTPVATTEEASLYSNRGPLSPFSPLLKTRNGQASTTTLEWQQEGLEEHLSLSACRRVSVVVQVNQPEQGEGDENRLCLFPLVTNQEQQSENITANPSKPKLSSTSATLQSAGTNVDSRDLVVVNPNAFGKLIPSKVTMETARLVAQIAHIQSEDWARTFRFHQVLWPGETTSLQHLCQAIVKDVTDVGSISVRTVLGMGNKAKTSSLFGTVGHKSVAQVLAQTAKDLQPPEILERYGLLGLTASGILEKVPEHAVCTLSILEIGEDEHHLYDLLATRPFAKNDNGATNKRLKLVYSGERHGAIIQGLSNVPLDSLKGLGHCLRRAFAAALHENRRHQRGHIIATLKVWQNAVQHDMQSKCTVAQFVDLATMEDETSAESVRHNVNVRKSLWALGGVLRGTLLKEAGNEAMISYRESALTKVLQRSLDHPDSRVVVLSNVSPLSDSYEETMASLRSASRLLSTRQASMSPFESQTSTTAAISSKATSPTSPTTTDQSPLSLNQFAEQEVLLANILSDPRQRLAKVMKPSRRDVQVDPKDLAVEAYIPTQYMNVDPATIGAPSPEAREESSTRHLYSTTLLPTPVTRNGPGKERDDDEYRKEKGHTSARWGPFDRVIQERTVDTSVALADEMERDDGYAEPSPLTADTGEANVFSLDHNFIRDDLVAQIAERKQQESLAVSEPTKLFQTDQVENDEHTSASAAPAPTTTPMDTSTSKLMGWAEAEDTFELEEAGEERENDAGLARNVADTSEYGHRNQGPNSQEMDDLSVELFRKSLIVHDSAPNIDRRQELEQDSAEAEDVAKGVRRQRTVQHDVQSTLPRAHTEDELVVANNIAPALEYEGPRAADKDIETSRRGDTARPSHLSVDKRSEENTGAVAASLQRVEYEEPRVIDLTSSQQYEGPAFEHNIPKYVNKSVDIEQTNNRRLSEKSNGDSRSRDVPTATSAGPNKPSFVTIERTSSREWLESLPRPPSREMSSAQQVGRQQDTSAPNVGSRSAIELANSQHSQEKVARPDHLHTVEHGTTAQLEEQAAQRDLEQREKDRRKLVQRETAQREKTTLDTEQRDMALRDAAQREMARRSEEYRFELHRRDQELVELQERFEKVETDRNELVKIAEEAIGTQAELEQRVTKLEGELSREAARRVSSEQLRVLEEANESLAQQVHEMQGEIYQYKTEMNDRNMSISELQFSVGNLEKERAHLVDLRSRDEEEIARLQRTVGDSAEHREDVAALQNEISRLRREYTVLESTSQRREAELVAQLTQRDKYVERCQQEAASLNRQLATVYDNQQTASVASQREISRLERRLSDAQKELALQQDQRREAEQRLTAALRSKEALAQELQRTRDNLDLRISDVQELSASLKQVLDDKGKEEARVVDMQEAMESFQNETRTRVEKVVMHRNEAAALLEKTLEENLALVATNQEMQAAVESLRRELDEVRWQSEQRVREERERDQYRWRSEEHERAEHRWGSAHELDGVYASRQDDMARNDDMTRRDDVLRRETMHTAVPPSEQNADRLARAEELAAYMALTAKSSAEQRSSEAHQLKQQLYSLEDTKDAEIEALKARIRGMERRLDSSRDGNVRTPRRRHPDEW